jgi:hypothetical protein
VAGIERRKINLRPRRGCTGSHGKNSDIKDYKETYTLQTLHHPPPIIRNFQCSDHQTIYAQLHPMAIILFI